MDAKRPDILPVPAWGAFAAPGAGLAETLPVVAARVTPEAALALALELAAALAELHERGYAHGGLEADRIGLDAGGDLIVLPSQDLPRADPDPQATAQATDCLQLADVLARMGLDRLAEPALPLLLDGLRRVPVRRRIQPGRAVRQTLAALVARHGSGILIPHIAKSAFVRDPASAPASVPPPLAAVEPPPLPAWLPPPPVPEPELVLEPAPEPPLLRLEEEELEVEPVEEPAIRFHPDDGPSVIAEEALDLELEDFGDPEPEPLEEAAPPVVVESSASLSEIPAVPPSAPEPDLPRWQGATGVSGNPSRETELGMGKWSEVARPLSELTPNLPEHAPRPLDLETPRGRWALWVALGAIVTLALWWALR